MRDVRRATPSGNGIVVIPVTSTPAQPSNMGSAHASSVSPPRVCIEVNTHLARMRSFGAGLFAGVHEGSRLPASREPMHRGTGRLVELSRVLGCPPDGRQTEPSIDGKARQHM